MGNAKVEFTAVPGHARETNLIESQGMRWRPAAGILICALSILTALSCSSDESGGDAIGDRFPIAVTDTRVEAGVPLYAANCATCHGVPGVSRPPVSTAPPHDEEGHTWHHPDRLLFEWVLDRPPLATTMPAFRGALSDDEILSILAYIKSTWPGDIQQFQEEGSSQYERQLRENS